MDSRVVSRRPAATTASPTAGDRVERYLRQLEARQRRERAMATLPPPTAEHVRDVVLRDLDVRTGRRGDWRLEGPVAHGRDSWVFKATTASSPGPLAVKVYLNDMPAEGIARQDANLRRYHAAMAGRSGLTVPAPWAALPEHRTLIMEWISEPLMGTLLAEAGRRRDRRAKLFAAAGAWLRHFHDQSTIDYRPLKTDRLRWQVDRSLGAEQGAGQRVRDTVFRHGYGVLVERAREFSQAPVATAVCHGDFTFNNLFHGAERTVGFDFGARHRMPVSYDICRFVSTAETAKPFLSRRATLAPQGVEAQDLEAFLAGYGPLEARLEGRLLSYLHLAEVLRRWAVLIGPKPGIRFPVLHPVTLFRLRRMVSYAAHHVEGRG